MFLSLDTFSENLGIALFYEGKLIYHISIYKFKPFSEFLVKKLDDIFKELSLDKRKIKKVIVNKGPGSYTGLRVGVSIGKSIAYSLKIPIYAYDSLSALAYKYRFVQNSILIGINAGKGEIYSQQFITSLEDIKQISEIKLLKKNEFLKLTNNFKITITKNIDLQGNNFVKDIEDLSIIGAEYALKNDLVENVYMLEPIYIRGL